VRYCWCRCCRVWARMGELIVGGGGWEGERAGEDSTELVWRHGVVDAARLPVSTVFPVVLLVGCCRVCAVQPHNMPVRNVSPYFAPMSDALNEIKQPSGKYRLDPQWPGSYALWNMDSKAWKEVRQPCFLCVDLTGGTGGTRG
jgi:hypothetical protein